MTRTVPAPSGSSTTGICRRRECPGSRGGERLVLGRQVHPELHHLQDAAVAGEALAVELLVDDAAPRPSSTARRRGRSAVVAGGVAVLELALVDDGHRLEPAMRMLADAARRLGRGELVGAGVVEQQERVELLALVVREQAAHRKAVADPVRRHVAADGFDLLHASWRRRSLPGGKITFQSFFMSTTIQPCFGASSRPWRAGRCASCGRRRIRARRRCGGRSGRTAGRVAAGGRPLEHLEVAVGVAEGDDRAAADELLDADRLAGLVVDEVDLRQLARARACRRAVRTSACRCCRRPARAECRRPARPRPHELDAAAGDDERLEAVGPQVREQLEHRLVDALGVRPVEPRMLGRGEPVA